MSVVLLTGASGLLGRHLLARPAAHEHSRRAMSRRAVPVEQQDAVRWMRGDLATGDGLAEALEGADVVVHAASDPKGDTRRTDVEGTGRLISAAVAAGVRHLIYVSIVGVDRIPLTYYRHKHEAEQLVERAKVPWTILRGTQFHDFMDGLFRGMTRFPIGIVPAGIFAQPVDTDEFADALWERVASGPGGRADDVAGPQVLSYREMLDRWMLAQRMHKLVIPLPIPGRAGAALRRGEGTSPRQAVGRVTWDAWLTRRYAPAAVSSEVYP
jgi:uncharacterized protein YbjT (DUF2867 family)